jgi:ribonuclease T2
LLPTIRCQLAALLLVLAMLPAVAQAPREYRGGTPGVFDMYVLALSWSSGFCTLEGDRRQREQCRHGAGLGFVVHGLWPQFEQGYPTECGLSDRTPSRIAMDRAKAVYPEEGLARHQWRKHGTCSGRSPSDYFEEARKARDKVSIPAAFQSPTEAQTWAVADLERAFVAANPGLRNDMIAVSCRRGVLQEVRICLSKDLRGFTACAEVDRGGCRTREITVPPVR